MVSYKILTLYLRYKFSFMPYFCEWEQESNTSLTLLVIFYISFLCVYSCSLMVTSYSQFLSCSYSLRKMICSSLDVMILARTDYRFTVFFCGVREINVGFGSVSDFMGGMSFLKDFQCYLFLLPFLDDTLDGVLEEQLLVFSLLCTDCLVFTEILEICEYLVLWVLLLLEALSRYLLVLSVSIISLNSSVPLSLTYSFLDILATSIDSVLMTMCNLSMLTGYLLMNMAIFLMLPLLENPQSSREATPYSSYFTMVSLRTDFQSITQSILQTFPWYLAKTAVMVCLPSVAQCCMREQYAYFTNDFAKNSFHRIWLTICVWFPTRAMFRLARDLSECGMQSEMPVTTSSQDCSLPVGVMRALLILGQIMDQRWDVILQLFLLLLSIGKHIIGGSCLALVVELEDFPAFLLEDAHIVL